MDHHDEKFTLGFKISFSKCFTIWKNT